METRSPKRSHGKCKDSLKGENIQLLSLSKMEWSRFTLTHLHRHRNLIGNVLIMLKSSNGCKILEKRRKSQEFLPWILWLRKVQAKHSQLKTILGLGLRLYCFSKIAWIWHHISWTTILLHRQFSQILRPPLSIFITTGFLFSTRLTTHTQRTSTYHSSKDFGNSPLN